MRLTISGVALADSAWAASGMGALNPMGAMTDAAVADSFAQADSQEASLMAAQASAQAAAARPGDDAKSCEALQTEIPRC